MILDVEGTGETYLSFKDATPISTAILIPKGARNALASNGNSAVHLYVRVVLCYTMLAQSMGCQNLRQRRSLLVRSQAHCHWLPPHDASLGETKNSDNIKLCWDNPPVALIRRYRSLQFPDEKSWDNSSDYDLEDAPCAGDSCYLDYSINSTGHMEFSLLAGNERVALFLSRTAP
jgi:hypothetical protein